MISMVYSALFTSSARMVKVAVSEDAGIPATNMSAVPKAEERQSRTS